MTPIISIMMVTYNRLELTKQTVTNIYETVKTPFEFIIIDNASSDDTIEYLNELNKQYDNIHLKFNKINEGIGYARSQCLLMADVLDTDWYVTIDNDVLFHEGWLNECIDILIHNKHFGAIGVSFEPILYPIITSNGYEFEYKSKGNLGTACMVFHKSLHKMIGFFNTSFDKYAHEDADWGNRIIFAGLKLGYIKTHGVHIGEGINDRGSYRDFKDQKHKENLPKYYENYNSYASGKKSLYIPFKERE